MFQAEAHAHALLSQVQLVSELNLDVDDELFVGAYSVLRQHLEVNGPNSAKTLHRSFPALTLIVITALAIEFGDGGELWDEISDSPKNRFRLPHLYSHTSPKFGESYRGALEVLGLPRFTHIGGRTNLTPILLHAGIPAASVGPVWKKLHSLLHAGYEDGAEIISLLRRDNSQMRYFKKPATRFIEEAGKYAVDLIQRMILLLLKDYDLSVPFDSEGLSDRHRLPKALVDRLREEELERIELQAQIPNPKVYVDLDSGRGVQVRLPAINQTAEGFSWRVTDGETVSYPAYYHDEHTHLLKPSLSWIVELVDGGERKKFREYRGFKSRDIWFLNRQGNVYEIQNVENNLEQDSLLVLVPIGTKIEIYNSAEEENTFAQSCEFIEFGGKWTRYTLLKADLSQAVKVVMTCKTDGVMWTEQITVLESPPKPMLLLNSPPDVQDIDGYRVCSSPPSIGFTRAVAYPELFDVNITRDGIHHSHHKLVDIPPVDEIYDLSEVIEWVAGSYSIHVLGPLGSDLYENFTCLPGIKVQVESHLVLPTEKVNVVLAMDGVDNFQVPFHSGVTRQAIRLKTHEPPLIFYLYIPRIVFSFAVDGEPAAFTTEMRQMTQDEIEELSNSRLLVRCRQQHKFQVKIRNDLNEEVAVRNYETFGEEGSCEIRLDVYRDDVRLAESELLTIQIEFPSTAPVTVATIRKKFDGKISSIKFFPSSGDSPSCVNASTCGSIVDYEHSVIIRSLDQPWRPIQEIKMIKGIGTISPAAGVVPGRYEVGVSLGNSRSILSSTKQRIQLGSNEDIKRYLLSLDESATSSAIRATLGLSRPRSISTDEFAEGVIQVGQFIIQNHMELERSSKSFNYGTSYLLLEDHTDIFGNWLSEVLANDSTRSTVELYLVRVFPMLTDCPLSELQSDANERIWNSSALVGAALTHSHLEGICPQIWTQRLGAPESEPDILRYLQLSEVQLQELLDSELGRMKVLSTNFANQGLVSLLSQCRKNAQNIQFIEEFNKEASRQIRRTPVFIGHELEVSAPPRLVEKGTESEWNIQAFVYNLHRLSQLCVDVSTPMDYANEASDLLATCYNLAKPLVQRSLLLAVDRRRTERTINVNS